MLLIPCPWCGPREEIEFRYAGEARTMPALTVGDDVWARYLFFRSNPVGGYTERWVHVHGCRRYVTLTRDTITHQITGAHFRGARVEDGQ